MTLLKSIFIFGSVTTCEYDQEWLKDKKDFSSFIYNFGFFQIAKITIRLKQQQMLMKFQLNLYLLYIFCGSTFDKKVFILK